MPSYTTPASLSFSSDITISYSPKEIEDYNMLVELWGVVHIIEDENITMLGQNRKMHKYELKCNREFQSDTELHSSDYHKKGDKPKNACPGCSPAMEEILKWK